MCLSLMPAERWLLLPVFPPGNMSVFLVFFASHAETIFYYEDICLMKVLYLPVSRQDSPLIRCHDRCRKRSHDRALKLEYCACAITLRDVIVTVNSLSGALLLLLAQNKIYSPDFSRVKSTKVDSNA